MLGSIIELARTCPTPPPLNIKSNVKKNVLAEADKFLLKKKIKMSSVKCTKNNKIMIS